jgi:nucleoid-associated protein YejK
MINFSNLAFRRMIMHTIIEKSNASDTATTEHSEELIPADRRVHDLIRKRLTDAAGKNSKAFELEFEQTGNGSCYTLCADLKNCNTEVFITRTQQAADLLAESQKRTSIPGGYLLAMEAVDRTLETTSYIFIKAEPHEALQQLAGHSGISIVEKVFLSPSQKFYKIGIIHEKVNPRSTDPNDAFGCFLFDDQFRLMAHPAEYFYKDFLGFSVGQNAKIQSQKFFEKTMQFIKDNVTDSNERIDLLRALRIEFTANTEPTIDPDNFAQRYFQGTPLRGLYQQEVTNDLPLSIPKDPTLIQYQLAKRKIDFPNNIHISGPEEIFDRQVQIINPENARDLDLNATGFTFVRIAGKPYAGE